MVKRYAWIHPAESWASHKTANRAGFDIPGEGLVIGSMDKRWPLQESHSRHDQSQGVRLMSRLC